MLVRSFSTGECDGREFRDEMAGRSWSSNLKDVAVMRSTDCVPNHEEYGIYEYSGSESSDEEYVLPKRRRIDDGSASGVDATASW